MAAGDTDPSAGPRWLLRVAALVVVVLVPWLLRVGALVALVAALWLLHPVAGLVGAAAGLLVVEWLAVDHRP
jgi:hypothetical protein